MRLAWKTEGAGLFVGGSSEQAGSARLVLVESVVHRDPEQAVFEAMLVGFERQQQARLLGGDTIVQRLRLFGACSSSSPTSTRGDGRPPMWRTSWPNYALGSGRRRSPRFGYETALRLFCEFVDDTRYGWANVCEERFGTHPIQICHEWNTAVHAAEFEGQPARRPSPARSSRRSSMMPMPRCPRWWLAGGRGRRRRSGTRCASRWSTPGGCVAARR